MKISEKQNEIKKLEKERKAIMNKIKLNDNRFRQIIAKLMFREKQLLAKIEDLQNLMNEKDKVIQSEKIGLKRRQSKVVNIDDYRHNAEEELETTQNKVAQLRYNINDLESALL